LERIGEKKGAQHHGEELRQSDEQKARLDSDGGRGRGRFWRWRDRW